MRPIIQTIARMIATDRRPSVLASEGGKVLLANAPAQRLLLDQEGIHDSLDWSGLCAQAHRAGSIPVSLTLGTDTLEGEIVHLSLGAGDGYLLRLASNDLEATWLRNRSRAATLMRVAHDLRTPIQSLLATAENVLDDGGQASEEQRNKAREQLQQTAEVALDHISNVLGVIRGEQSVAGIRPDETFNLTEELRTLVMMISPIARNQDVALKLWLDPHEDIWVHGPVRFVRALFQNIIDNSAKYGGKEVEIGLTCRPLPSPETGVERLKIILTVKDMGGGIPPEQQARLRAALGQGDAAQPPAVTERKDRPSAGMNVLAHALRQLGGTLELSDRYAEGAENDRADHAKDVIGTTIKATFMLQKGEKADNFSPSAPPEQDASLQGVSMILVEDSPTSRDWLQHILTSAGAKVWPAGNGIEALSLLDKSEIADNLDLILTDMTLPYMSGVEFAQRVRQTRKGGWNGPILALTAHVVDEIITACHKAGIAKVLEKPIRPAQLSAAILAVLHKPDESEPPVPHQSKVAKTSQTVTAVLKDEVVQDLLSQLGTEGAMTYMQRAHAEAKDILTKLKSDGVGPDTGRMLHAATGVSSLTGLGALENCLRTMECAFDEGGDLPSRFPELEECLDLTQEAIHTLAKK
ncbi:response regulator [Celeribacter halophilus]|uniref:hybrid sensor histidine kinase/response regulator n=1 Tax=Celeribacter halophilus TaxID=576117 RepID=UPI003A93D34C